MKLIFRCKFGSHLYGTNTENSDLDYKSVFIPEPRDLILQKAPKTISTSTKAGSVNKNTADDVDDESFSVQQYIKLLLEGQTGALDMLFCPDDLIIHKTLEWDLIKLSKDKFLHSGTSAFVGYTKQQAAKYGVKGFRVSALRDILSYLKGFNDHACLDDVLRQYSIPENENIKIVKTQGKSGTELHLEVCNRKVPFGATVKYAKEVYQRIFDMYGERALKAEKNEGVDWKALSHAVRVANESIELLETGKITFPRPDKDLLLAIKKGQIPYKEVEKIIEEGLLKVEQAQKISKLPKEPDRKFSEELIFSLYKSEIEKEYFERLD
jgi:hypothetical protein